MASLVYTVSSQLSVISTVNYFKEAHSSRQNVSRGWEDAGLEAELSIKMPQHHRPTPQGSCTLAVLCDQHVYHTSLEYSAWCSPSLTSQDFQHGHLAFLLNTWTLNTNAIIEYATLSEVLENDPLHGYGKCAL